MRGSAWVYCEFWLTTRQGTVNHRTIRDIYGYSEVRDMNTKYQQQEQFTRALNKAKGTYLQEVDVASDTEFNYSLLNSGMQIRNDDKPIERRRLSRVSPVYKRQAHRQIRGNYKPLTLKEMRKQYIEEKPIKIEPKQFKEQTRKEYKEDEEFRRMLKKTLIFKEDNEIKVTKKNVRGYLGMNNPASKELRLSKKSRPKKNEIFIDKSLKGRKKRQVIAHEIYEQQQMNKGLKYKQAHKKALKIEKKVK